MADDLEPRDGLEPSDGLDFEPSSTDVDAAIPLGSHETVAWQGRPRTTVILPSALFGLLLAVAGVVAALSLDTGLPLVLLSLALVLVGLALPLSHYLVVSNTTFLVTDRALYHKRGVLGRAVTQANLETVQNSSYSKGITGSLFGYGSVEFEIAGGSDLAFRDIHNPEPVRALVDRATRNQDGISGGRPRSVRFSTIPGDLETWQEVRTEVQSIRRLFDGE